LTLGILLCVTGRPAAAPVRGKVLFSEDPRGVARYHTYWRVPNGVLPVLPASQDVRTESVVVLYPQGTVTGAQVAAAEAQEQKGPVKLEMKLSGLKLIPPVVVVTPGATVTLRNEDRQDHEINFICNPTGAVAPRQTIAGGETATLTFDKQGDCVLHSTEFAHLTGAVLVVDRGFYGRLDASGAFQFDAPEGHYLARLFFRGSFAASQTIDVLAEGLELTLKVGPPTGAAAAQRTAAAADGDKRRGGKGERRRGPRP
jgi:plastocyanin